MGFPPDLKHPLVILIRILFLDTLSVLPGLSCNIQKGQIQSKNQLETHYRDILGLCVGKILFLGKNV